MQNETVVVVAGGGPLRPELALEVRGAPVLAADAGLDRALELELEPVAVIGDMDSVSPVALTNAAERGMRVIWHPTAKDATDLELALDEALALSPRRVVVLADDGGRLDHLLSALLLLGSPRYAAVLLDGQIGAALVHVIRDERALEGAVGETISLLALHGAAEGVTTDGLAFPLFDEELDEGSSRGVSNVFSESSARVSIRRGVLLAVRPGAEDAT